MHGRCSIELACALEETHKTLRGADGSCTKKASVRTRGPWHMSYRTPDKTPRNSSRATAAAIAMHPFGPRPLPLSTLPTHCHVPQVPPKGSSSVGWLFFLECPCVAEDSTKKKEIQSRRCPGRCCGNWPTEKVPAEQAGPARSLDRSTIYAGCSGRKASGSNARKATRRP